MNLKQRARAWIWMQCDTRPFRLVFGLFTAGALFAGGLVLLGAIVVTVLR